MLRSTFDDSCDTTLLIALFAKCNTVEPLLSEHVSVVVEFEPVIGVSLVKNWVRLI